jgi:hypothetical protein
MADYRLIFFLRPIVVHYKRFGSIPSRCSLPLFFHSHFSRSIFMLSKKTLQNFHQPTLIIDGSHEPRVAETMVLVPVKRAYFKDTEKKEKRLLTIF